MSEINDQTIDDLNEDIEIEVEDEDYVPTPVDPTLQNEGEAADAKATGDAIAEVLNGLTVNGQSPNASKQVTVLAEHIKMDASENAQTVVQAIEDANGRTADEIMYDAANLVSISDKIGEMDDDFEADFTEEEAGDLLEEVYGGDE